MIAMLLALMVQAGAAPAPLAEPEAFRESMIVGRETLATRAVRAARAAALPAAARTGRVQCIVGSFGFISDCARIVAAPFQDDRSLMRAVIGARDAATGGPLESEIAKLLVQYRFAPMAEGAAQRSIVFDLASLFGAGPPRLPPSRGRLEMVAFAPGATDGLSDAYPPSLIREGAEAAVRVDCRVMADYSLFCRNPVVVRAAGLPPERTDAAFEEVTVRTLARMHVVTRTDAGVDTAGHDVTRTFNWRLPK